MTYKSHTRWVCRRWLRCVHQMFFYLFDTKLFWCGSASARSHSKTKHLGLLWTVVWVVSRARVAAGNSWWSPIVPVLKTLFCTNHQQVFHRDKIIVIKVGCIPINWICTKTQNNGKTVLHKTVAKLFYTKQWQNWFTLNSGKTVLH